MLGRQRRERGQQPGIHRARPELRGVLRSEPDARVLERLRARALACREIGSQRGLVSGRSAGFGRAGGDPAFPDPKIAITAGAYVLAS